MGVRKRRLCLRGEGCDGASCAPPVLRPSADTCMCDILGLDDVTEVIKLSVSIKEGSCELLRVTHGHEIKPLKQDDFFTNKNESF